jgi:hypothetical protein
LVNEGDVRMIQERRFVEEICKRKCEWMRSNVGIAAGGKPQAGEHKYGGMRKGNERGREEETMTAGWGDKNINSLSHVPE